MSKRLAMLVVLIAATVLMSAVPSTTLASAPPSPWWQLLTGSRPTNMWEPRDSVQEIKTEKTLFFGELTAAAKVEVDGNAIGCLASTNPNASSLCGFYGFPVSSTAAELEALLEPAMGLDVEVTGGPVGGEPFLVTAHAPAPPIKFFQPNFQAGTFTRVVRSEYGSGRLVITLTNLGDAPVDGGESPVRIVDELPEGMVATGVEAAAGAFETYGPIHCSLEGPAEVVCDYEGELPSYEAIEVEISVDLIGSPPAQGGPGQVTVSGGNAPAASAVQTVHVSDEPVEFGIEHFSAVAEDDVGKSEKQAGSHPFQFTTTLQLNAGAALGKGKTVTGARPITTQQPALPRNLRFPLPPGVVGNATAVPTCDMKTFLASNGIMTNACPDGTALGVTSVTIVESAQLGLLREAVPVFNLPPGAGEPARFGFVAAGVPVVIDTEVDPEDYRITARVSNVSQVAQFLAATTAFWGTPGDPRHDSSRGWGCAWYNASNFGLPCSRPADQSETAFLRMPVQCRDPLAFGLSLEPWNVPLGSQVETASSTGPPLVGCNKVPFDPAIVSAPTSKLAQNPSGLSFELNMPNAGLDSGEAIAEAQPKKAMVILPEGMSINPSQGEGLAGCSPSQFARETASSRPGEGCPDAAKIGTVDVSTPLLKEEAHGALYVASPYDNPSGSLIGLYMVARIPERGIVIKQAGKVETDPVTGQITTTFDDIPQLPFSSFNLHFREGGRAPLVTPPICGNYDITAKFVPWSAQDPDNPTADEVVTKTSTFTVERGVDGGACPSGGTPPFHPGLDAGTLNNAAGSFSPFNVRLTRKDGEQEFTNFSLKLPPGLSGKLAGVPFCPDGAIAAAKARTGSNGGQEELDAPSCPAASEIGHTLVGAGVGSSLTYVPGKVYLAGPYHGSSLSIAAITAAKVGPFDLGTVVVRQALRVNPDTAEVFIDATGSDPIPHIIQGIPVHARDIRVYVDRPGFTLNPTSCEPTSVASTVLGSGLDFGSAADDNPVTVTTRFQAADCAALPFKPKLSMRLFGKTNRGANPRLRATLRMNGFGEAGIARAAVTLPHSEFLDQSHIRTVCTRVQFNAGEGNGAQCPKGSVYGRARAWTPLLDEPVEGPVFLRSSSHPLPDLVAALHGSKIDVNLVGRIDSVGNGQIRNTFEAVPDAPVTKFVLEMQGGKKGLLENSTNICKGRHQVRAIFKGHNGKQHTVRPALKGDCGGKKNRRGS